jgi:hypothetical protein
MTPETLARLEAAARKQIGHEISTGVTVTPGELLALIEYARHPVFLVDLTTQRIEPVLGPSE